MTMVTVQSPKTNAQFRPLTELLKSPDLPMHGREFSAAFLRWTEKMELMNAPIKMQLLGHQAAPHQTHSAGLIPRRTSKELKRWRDCLNLARDYSNKKDMMSWGFCWSLSDLEKSLRGKLLFGWPKASSKIHFSKRIDSILLATVCTIIVTATV